MVTKYFSECSLIIDEADSILIDELTNGTIISRPLMSDATDILKYIYHCIKNCNVEKKLILEQVKKAWPNCTDINIDDIEEMEREIEIVNQPEFKNGIKYSIEKKVIKEKRSFVKKNKKKNDDDDEVKAESIIIPFDYDNKGILEPNKEFNGFIQQFIAIKELNDQKSKKDIKINDISMNYLYVSHPIFVKLYGGVCGLTGTIGNQFEKIILKKSYKISTKKIPRNLPNHRIELPMILCSDIKERNKMIVDEVIEFHIKGIPVLVILKNLNEISDIYNSLSKSGIRDINIFDGKDEKMKPDIITGLKSAVSLGTNFCGRGADI